MYVHKQTSARTQANAQTYARGCADTWWSVCVHAEHKQAGSLYSLAWWELINQGWLCQKWGLFEVNQNMFFLFALVVPASMFTCYADGEIAHGQTFNFDRQRWKHVCGRRCPDSRWRKWPISPALIVRQFWLKSNFDWTLNWIFSILVSNICHHPISAVILLRIQWFYYLFIFFQFPFVLFS